MQYNFTPQWISGFTIADGSFTVSWSKHGGAMPIRPYPAFTLTQTIRELPMMTALHTYLGVGQLHINREAVSITVRSLTEIINVILPLFDANPLLGAKLKSYLVFKTVVLAINMGGHLSLTSLLSILKLSYFTHSTTLRTQESLNSIIAILVKKFGTLPEVMATELVSSNTEFSISIEWLAGLIDGDGSFNFGFNNTRRRVVANFTIAIGLGDELALEAVQSYLGCGTIYSLASAASRLQIENVKDLISMVIPVLLSAKFNTVKQEHFIKSIQAWQILAEHGVASDLHLKTVVNLVYDMNLGGVRRKLTKEQYLNKFISPN